ncbi:MAG: phosphatidylglycerol:prolipoprotein diacylglycerol transferase [Planctomycetota bacterium]|jgi:phosphatidylglycerol:prolipoprotein diacylglycerol transferase
MKNVLEDSFSFGLIPYWELQSFLFAGTRISTFMASSMLALVVGGYATLWLAKSRQSREMREVLPMLAFTIIFGYIGAHVLHVIGYEAFESVSMTASRLGQVQSGLSSIGGLMGGGLGALLHARLAGRRGALNLDVLALGAAAGLVPGRLGCFLVHDHPGRASEFFMAVSYPGGARHDLGLYEACVAALVVIGLLRIAARFKRPGIIAAGFCLLYCLPRFALDFLRVRGEEAQALVAEGLIRVGHVDITHAGLTAGQWVCLLALAGSVLWCKRGLR